MDFFALFSNFPPEIATLLIAMLPVGELRASIPIALGIYHLNIFSAYFFSVLGNIIPIIFLLWLLGPASGYLIERFSWAKRFFEWLFTRTRHKFSKNYVLWGEIALVIFVAVPLPMTGGWTGAIAAFIFGIPKIKSLFLISLGIALAGILVVLATTGVIALI